MAFQGPAAAQQPAAPRIRIPIPTVPPFLPVPGEAHGDVRDWLRTFDSYLRCVERNQDPQNPLHDDDKNALLISHLGQEGLKSFGGTPVYDLYMTPGQQTTFADLRQAVSTHFRRTPSVFKARYDFYSRKQDSGESVQEFDLALRALAVDCGFEDIRQAESVDEHIKTQLVLHTNLDKAKLELFARRGAMTLEEVRNFLKAAEAAEEDTRAIGHKSAGPASIHNVRGRPRGTSQRGLRPSTSSRTCVCCGQEGHTTNSDPTCPARGKTCLSCGRVGHFSRVCKDGQAPPPRGSTTTSRGTSRGGRGNRRGQGCTIPQGGPAARGAYTDPAETHQCYIPTNTGSFIFHNFDIWDGTAFYPMSFMVDTGANTSIITAQSYKKWFGHIPLTPYLGQMYAVDGHPVQQIMGTFATTIRFGARAHKSTFHVLQGNVRDILGNNFIPPLKVTIDGGNLSVSATSTPLSELQMKYPTLFKDDLGTFSGPPHKLHISEEATPVAVQLRPVPFSQKQAVEEEICLLDRQGVWEPVQSSQWAHPMVVVPKKDGGVRITTDLTRLNTHVIPERFPLPRIRDLLTNMAGSKVFSKVDLKKGYFQIPLHKDSSHLTTTITPLGLRQYLRLPMGLKDAASAFQRRVQQCLQGVPGVEAYIDDIIIHGKTQVEHDHRLAATFQ